MFKKFFVPIFFLITTVTLAKAEWVKINTKSDSKETHYFDPETIKNNGHFRKVWIMTNYLAAQPGGYRSVKSFYEFDCKKQRARSYTMLLYSDEMAAGNVIGAQHDKLKEWSSYPPGSLFSRIADRVCANLKRMFPFHHDGEIRITI